MYTEKTEGSEIHSTTDSEVETQEAAKEEPTVHERAVEGVEGAPKAPEPTAIGDENITILRHDMYRRDSDSTTEFASIELAAKNVSETAIGSVLFAAELYDIEGNSLDNIEQKTFDFKPGVTRKIILKYTGPERDKVRSYCVKVASVVRTPESKVIGDEKVKIVKHSLNTGEGELIGIIAGADLVIKNVSDSTIASILFKVEFYDIEGNIFDTVRHKESELKPNASRSIRINCNQQHAPQIKGYNIEIVRIMTTEAEKILLRHEQRIKTNTGEEEVRGIVKNISNVKLDAALVATFFNQEKESIGTKVIILKDIEPNCTRQFNFTFKPMEGDKVKSHTLDIGDLVA